MSIYKALFNRPKYRNQKVKVNGVTFDSKTEYERYLALKMLEKAGKIKDLKTQVKFELVKGVRFQNEKRKKPALTYIADFTYIKDGELIVEDVKSAITRENGVYRIKKHLMMAIHNIEIIEVCGTRTK